MDEEPPSLRVISRQAENSALHLIVKRLAGGASERGGLVADRDNPPSSGAMVRCGRIAKHARAASHSPYLDPRHRRGASAERRRGSRGRPGRPESSETPILRGFGPGMPGMPLKWPAATARRPETGQFLPGEPSALAFSVEWSISRLFELSFALLTTPTPAPIPKTSLKSDQARTEVVWAKRIGASWR